MLTSLEQELAALAPQLRDWRRDFHRHAEPGWLELRTASIVAEELDRLGFELAVGRDVVASQARMGLPDEQTLALAEHRALEQGAVARWLPALSGGFTGVVATLDSGRPGPTLAIRVDLDALDLEESGAADHRPRAEGFASLNRGAMHACGHDGHTAIGLGLARLLKRFEAELHGRIKLIFQPAEEGVRGARSMVEAGVVDDVDLLIASHIGLDRPLGEVVCAADGFLATTKLDVEFKGVPAHAGGRPEAGRNALLAAAQAALGLHAIAPHSLGASRVNVGVLEAGSGRNVIAAVARMKIETRGESSEINAYVEARAREVIDGAAIIHGVEASVSVAGGADTCKASPALVERIRTLLEGAPGIDRLVTTDPSPSGSEDATCLMARVQARGGQATYMIFGTELAAGHHHQRFDFDEQVLPLAVRTLLLLSQQLTAHPFATAPTDRSPA